MTKILKIQNFKTSINKTKIPFVEKPLIAKNTIYAPEPERTNTRKTKGFFSGLFDMIDKAIDKVSEVFSSTSSKNITKTQSKIDYVFEEKKDEYRNLCQEYQNVFGQNVSRTTFPYVETLTKSQIEEKIILLRETISHEKLMLKLEKQFTKGPKHYLPRSSERHFSPNTLSEIFSRKSLSYKENIRFMCNRFLNNSSKIDKTLTSFNDLSKNYFKEAAISLKEIYDLKSSNKWFERIPKLGIIPKLLRVKDQVRLTKCVMKDYTSVSKSYVENGVMPTFEKYNLGYQKILQYKKEHPIKAFFYKRYTKKYLDKVNTAREIRLLTASKMTERFAKSGANINNVCENIKKQGVNDLARKAVFSLISFF